MKKIIGGIVIILVVLATGNGIKKESQKKNVQNNAPETESSSPTSISSSPIENSKKELVIKDLSYGTDARNKMNVIVPKGSNEKTPFILLIHGGAWYMGDKNDLAPIQLVLATKGIASASMNYRYASPTLDHTDLMNDVSKAIGFIAEKGTEWNLNTQKIALGGASAGAHMSLLYAYKYDSENRISSVISLAGPTDITDPNLIESVTNARLIQGLNDMAGGNPESASPANNIKNVPTLLVHGTKDTIVPYSQATSLNTLLTEKNIPHKLVTITGANHDLGIANPNNLKKTLDAMTNWIKTYR
jgi:acetyl esterase/lipase